MRQLFRQCEMHCFKAKKLSRVALTLNIVSNQQAIFSFFVLILLFFLYLFLRTPSFLGEEIKKKEYADEWRMRPKKRQLHELSYTEMAKMFIQKLAYCVVHNLIILFGQIPTVDVTRILTGLTGLQQFSCIWGQVNR